MIAQTAGNGIIVGVGINVAMEESELPVAHATSLLLQNFGELNRNVILAAFLNEFANLLERWEEGEDLRHLYLERCSSIGAKIQAELPGGVIKSGVAVGISPNGEYLVMGSQTGSVFVLDIKKQQIQVEEIYDDEHMSPVQGCIW